jgi:hypothetical protein
MAIESPTTAILKATSPEKLQSRVGSNEPHSGTPLHRILVNSWRIVLTVYSIQPHFIQKKNLEIRVVEQIILIVTVKRTSLNRQSGDLGKDIHTPDDVKVPGSEPFHPNMNAFLTAFDGQVTG